MTQQLRAERSYLLETISGIETQLIAALEAEHIPVDSMSRAALTESLAQTTIRREHLINALLLASLTISEFKS